MEQDRPRGGGHEPDSDHYQGREPGYWQSSGRGLGEPAEDQRVDPGAERPSGHAGPARTAAPAQPASPAAAPAAGRCRGGGTPHPRCLASPPAERQRQAAARLPRRTARAPPAGGQRRGGARRPSRAGWPTAASPANGWCRRHRAAAGTGPAPRPRVPSPPARGAPALGERAHPGEHRSRAYIGGSVSGPVMRQEHFLQRGLPGGHGHDPGPCQRIDQGADGAFDLEGQNAVGPLAVVTPGSSGTAGPGPPKDTSMVCTDRWRRSASVPCPTSRPARKMPARSQSTSTSLRMCKGQEHGLPPAFDHGGHREERDRQVNLDPGPDAVGRMSQRAAPRGVRSQARLRADSDQQHASTMAVSGKTHHRPASTRPIGAAGPRPSRPPASGPGAAEGIPAGRANSPLPAGRQEAGSPGYGCRTRSAVIAGSR